MNVRLSKHDERFISDCVASGAYRSVDELIREALLLVKQREEQRNLKVEALRRDIDVAERQFERGEYSQYSADEMPRLARAVQEQGRHRSSRRTSARVLERYLAAGYKATAARDRKLTREWDQLPDQWPEN